MPPLSSYDTDFSHQHHRSVPSWGKFNIFGSKHVVLHETQVPIKKTRRAVSFASESKVFELPQYSDDEMIASWVNRDDLRRIKEECTFTIHVLKAGRLADDDDFTMRGLENRTRAARLKRQTLITEAQLAVFQEQKCLEEEGISDPEGIANIYRDFTTLSRSMAMLKGYHDEQNAKNIYS